MARRVALSMSIVASLIVLLSAQSVQAAIVYPDYALSSNATVTDFRALVGKTARKALIHWCRRPIVSLQRSTIC